MPNTQTVVAVLENNKLPILDGTYKINSTRVTNPVLTGITSYIPANTNLGSYVVNLGASVALDVFAGLQVGETAMCFNQDYTYKLVTRTA